jgi:hypothetical protein
MKQHIPEAVLQTHSKALNDFIEKELYVRDNDAKVFILDRTKTQHALASLMGTLEFVMAVYCVLYTNGDKDAALLHAADKVRGIQPLLLKGVQEMIMELPVRKEPL